MRTGLIAAALLAATPALAEYKTMEAEGSVDDAVARLETAIESAGASIFTVVDHGQGAADAGLDLPQSRLVIFGNPKAGTPIMQKDMLAGLVLPLKILVYSDGEQTFVAHQAVEDMFADLDIGEDAAVLDPVSGALDKLSSAAAGGS